MTEEEFSQHIDSFKIRPHLVILGAGATMAAIPNGDKNGRKSSVMNNFVSELGLDSILKDVIFQTDSRNIEDVYSELSENDDYKTVRTLLEDKIRKYFESFEILDTPTIYDLLIISLRDKDCIASFNWDNLLIQAYQRVYKITKNLPRLIFLHGNVSAGGCPKCGCYGLSNSKCPECGQSFVPSPLLYPVKTKDYITDPFINTQWHQFKTIIQYAGFITIFGYSAPKTDVEAIRIMQEAFSTESKFWHKIEIIDIDDESKIKDTWSFFGEQTHWHLNVVRSYFDTNLAEFPRRSLEGYYKRNLDKRVWFGNSGIQIKSIDVDLMDVLKPLFENELNNNFEVI